MLMQKPPHCLLNFHFFSQCCIFSFQKAFSTLYYIASNLWGRFVFVYKNTFLVGTWQYITVKITALKNFEPLNNTQLKHRK